MGEWQEYVGWSDDDGKIWGPEVMLAPDLNGLQGSPVIAVGDLGTICAVMDMGGGAWFVFPTSDDDSAWPYRFEERQTVSQAP